MEKIENHVLIAVNALPSIIQRTATVVYNSDIDINTNQFVTTVWRDLLKIIEEQNRNAHTIIIPFKGSDFLEGDEKLKKTIRQEIGIIIAEEYQSKRLECRDFDLRNRLNTENLWSTLAGCVGEINALKDTIPHKDKDTIVPHKEIFCSRMLALLCGYASEGEFSAKDSKEENIKKLVLTSEFIKAIFDGSETKKSFPKNFSALLPVKSCTSEVTSSIWEELLKQASLVSEDIHRSASPSNKNNLLQTIGSNVPTTVCDHVLPELLPLVLKRIERIANTVAFSEVLPKLGNRDVARRLVTQHLSDPYGSDAEFLVQSLLGVPKEKEAKENLRKQIPDVPLAVDKVVDYLVAHFASSLDKLQESGRNIVEWQIAGIRRQIDFSIQGVHEELQQQAAAKAQKEEFYTLCTTARATLDECIRNCLPSSFDDKRQKPNWNKVKLTDKVYEEFIEYLPSQDLSDQEKKDVIRDALPESLAVLEVLYEFSPRLRDGKRFNGATPEDQQRYIRNMLNINDENLDDIIAAATACAQLPKTPEEYHSMMQHQAANTQNH
jgi:hypothetical protein